MKRRSVLPAGILLGWCAHFAAASPSTPHLILRDDRGIARLTADAGLHDDSLAISATVTGTHQPRIAAPHIHDVAPRGCAVALFGLSLPGQCEYVFGVTEDGRQLDARVDRFEIAWGSADRSWDARWDCKVTSTDTGWTVRLRIPLAVFEWQPVARPTRLQLRARVLLPENDEGLLPGVATAIGPKITWHPPLGEVFISELDPGEGRTGLNCFAMGILSRRDEFTRLAVETEVLTGSGWQSAWKDRLAIEPRSEGRLVKNYRLPAGGGQRAVHVRILDTETGQVRLQATRYFRAPPLITVTPAAPWVAADEKPVVLIGVGLTRAELPDARLTVAVTPSGSRERLASRMLRGLSDPTTRLELDALPAGSYEISASLRAGPEGKIRATQRTSLRVLPAS